MPSTPPRSARGGRCGARAAATYGSRRRPRRQARGRPPPPAIVVAPSVAPAADAHDLGMAAVDGPPAGSAGPDPAAHEVDLREVVLPEVARPQAAPQSPPACAGGPGGG